MKQILNKRKLLYINKISIFEIMIQYSGKTVNHIAKHKGQV